MRSYGCVRVSLPLRPDDRVGHAATFPVFGGWFRVNENGAFFCCLDAQNGLTFTGTARRRFSPLSAGSSVLDALWIVAIILEQPAYALIVPSRPIRFWLLILSLQVLPQNKIKLISSEKKLPQLFDFIWAPQTEVPGLNDIKKLRCHWLLILFCCPHCCSR